MVVRSWLLFLWILLGAGTWAEASPAASGRLVLSEQLDYIQDASGQQSVDHILALPPEQWSSARGQTVNFGFTRAVYWLSAARSA
jgi:hypothetical protein